MGRLTKYGKTSHENGVCCTHFMSKECREVGGECSYGCKWEEEAWSKLAHYEDLEEAGRLIELPCAVGDTVWTYWIDDEESGVMADVPMSEQECLIIRSLWGKDYFATREEAVRKLDELKGE